jgi:hypothetical protein
MPASPFARFFSSIPALMLAVVGVGRPAVASNAIDRAEITVAEATDIVRGRRDWEVCLPDLTTLSAEVATALANGPG